MERLTDRYTHRISYNGERDIKCSSYCDNCSHADCDTIREMLYKLKVYEDAEENGLLVQLPCRVGDKLYHINGKFILEFAIYSFNVDENGAWLIHVEHYSEEADRTFLNCFETDAIGKTVFLTKADAEAKLKEMEGEDEDSN